MKLSKTQIIALAIMLGALGTMMSSLHHWHDVFHPGFIGGVLGIISANLLSLFSDNPKDAK